jgi:hypothetical protein
MEITRKDTYKYLNNEVIPLFRELGFSGSLPHFRRIKGETIDLMTFQFDRNGGGFLIELAKAKNNAFTTHWGEKIEPKKLTAYDVNTRERIHPKGILENSNTEDWFRYDTTSFFNNPLNKIKKQIIKNIKVIESWFAVANPTTHN